jgi:hypothetical protein
VFVDPAVTVLLLVGGITAIAYHGVAFTNVLPLWDGTLGDVEDAVSDIDPLMSVADTPKSTVLVPEAPSASLIVSCDGVQVTGRTQLAVSVKVIGPVVLLLVF